MARAALLEPPVRRWRCPNCGRAYGKRAPAVQPGGGAAEFHPCPRLRGMLAPMVPDGVSAKVELHEREDYVGREQVFRDPELGRPVMSITTTRADGSMDAVVFAPTATATVG